MGSTIRRQPITRNVPNAPDYKFLNLTSFGGLNMTDNPFTAPYNTASDCKNVYVDEFNALTTRPRLEKKYDIAAKLPDDSEIVDIHNLVNGYLIHYTVNNSYYMKILLNSGDLKTITGEIPTKKCTVFENGDVIYLLDGASYKNIKEYVISDVEGYVPTTTIGKTNTSKGSSYETLNILSDKYKETYFWDGSYNLSEIESENDISFQNDYVTKETKTSEDSTDSETTASRFWKKLNNVNENERWLTDWQGTLAYTLYDEKNKKFKKEIVADEYDYGVVYTDASLTGSNVVAITKGFRQTSPNDIHKLRFYRHGPIPDNTAFTEFRSIFEKEIALNDKNSVKISNDGNIIIALIHDINSGESTINIFKKNAYEEYEAFKVISGNPISFDVSNDFNTIAYITCDEKTQYKLNITKESFNTTVFPEPETYDLTSGIFNDVRVVVGHTKDVCACVFDKEIFLFENVVESSIFEKIYDADLEPTDIIKFSRDDNFLYVFRKYRLDPDNKNIILNTTDRIINLSAKSKSSFDFTTPPLNTERSNVQINDDGTFYILEGLTDEEDDYMWSYINKTLLALNSSEPLITITKKISENDENYEKRISTRNAFLNSKLFTRFENNWWFASDNCVFKTNDDSLEYIPLYNTSFLGNSKETITGFNVVQDDLLVAYKKNKMWVIRPTEINGIQTYMFSESKNTVGNTAFGSSIITALTEMPLQINYDGIYVLRQLENVQSSDRISTLISDAISKKWLKESKNTIDNAKTINRLYWTYIVLKDKDKTKIYLLDNRTTSWFYWELPINLLNIFVKDDVTQLVDVDGNIYILTTTDIPSESVQGKLNYYDDGHKVIDWFWNSQILSLNTINYSKRLIDTTFILTDTDTQDNYSLDYKFKAYRKLVDETDYTTLQNDIKYVQSVTKKTLIPRFKFLQIELSNDKSDDWDDYNKVRLIGLGLKYVLLEVMR